MAVFLHGCVQIVTITSYTYFAMCLFGRQAINTDKEADDSDAGELQWFPLFTFLQFSFFMAWVKASSFISSSYHFLHGSSSATKFSSNAYETFLLPGTPS